MSKKVIFCDFSSEKSAKSTDRRPKTAFFSFLTQKRVYLWVKTYMTKIVDRALFSGRSALGTVLYGILLVYCTIYVRIKVYYTVYIREKKLYS